MERLKQAEFARMSWCEADVFDLHGDVFPQTGMMSQIIEDAQCALVYPDSDPRGGIDGARLPIDRNPRMSPDLQPPGLEPTLEQEIRNLNAPESLPQPRAEGYVPMRLPTADTQKLNNDLGYLPPMPSSTNFSSPPVDRNVVPAQAVGAPPLWPTNRGGIR
jgi:hypothetical protein